MKKKRYVNDLTGKEFGTWLVLPVCVQAYSKGGRNRTRWLCQCKLCGNKRFLVGRCLGKRSKRCSLCYKKELHTKRMSASALWRGHGEIFGARYSSYVRNAKQRGIEFDLSIEDAWELFLAQGGWCSLTGRCLRFGTRDEETTASLDRIDSTVGYTKENCQWVHKDANISKMNYQQGDFVSLCMDVADYRRLLDG